MILGTVCVSCKMVCCKGHLGILQQKGQFKGQRTGFNVIFCDLLDSFEDSECPAAVGQRKEAQ